MLGDADERLHLHAYHALIGLGCPALTDVHVFTEMSVYDHESRDTCNFTNIARIKFSFGSIAIDDRGCRFVSSV